MTDEITCPECNGAGGSSIGSLRLQCDFCHGAGVVGGDNEPASDGPRYTEDGWKVPEEGDEYDPEVHGPLPSVGSHPAVTESNLCPTCLGARVVMSLGRDDQASAPATVAEAPCPVCVGKRQ